MLTIASRRTLSSSIMPSMVLLPLAGAQPVGAAPGVTLLLLLLLLNVLLLPGAQAPALLLLLLPGGLSARPLALLLLSAAHLVCDELLGMSSANLAVPCGLVSPESWLPGCCPSLVAAAKGVTCTAGSSKGCCCCSSSSCMSSSQQSSTGSSCCCCTCTAPGCAVAAALRTLPADFFPELLLLLLLPTGCGVLMSGNCQQAAPQAAALAAAFMAPGLPPACSNTVCGHSRGRSRTEACSSRCCGRESMSMLLRRSVGAVPSSSPRVVAKQVASSLQMNTKPCKAAG